MPNRLLGTLLSGAAEATEASRAVGITKVVSRADRKKHIQDVLSCSVIVYDLHFADLDEVEEVLKALKIAKLDHEVVFVLISGVSVWGRTRVTHHEVKGDEEEEEQVDEEGVEVVKEPPKKAPETLKDTDYHRRIPCPGFEAWKTLETLALSLNPKEKLRSHVVAAGVFYGNGEQTFNDFFKHCWQGPKKLNVFGARSRFTVNIAFLVLVCTMSLDLLKRGSGPVLVDKGLHEVG